MPGNALIYGLIMYLAFVAFTALHEFAHAWVADRCGDDTPRLQGRLTLDPIAHMDLVGTVLLPLAITFFSASGGTWMLFGWGKPVMVNLNNFRQRRRDDILVSAAGPAMNLLTGIAVLLVMKIVQVSAGLQVEQLDTPFNLARLSLVLCFFNLLPIPPLDGGHIMRNLIGMSDEAYAVMSQYSFLIFIVVMQLKVVGYFIASVTNAVLSILIWPLGWQLAG